MALRQDYESDWQLACGEIKKRSGYLLQTGLWSDCAFLVGSGADQAEMKAHKLILAMASPVFEAMFFGPLAERNHAIPVPDMRPEAFKGLLEYIYTDNIDISSFNTACELYYGAQKYMLPHLLSVCTIYLSCNLEPSKAGRTYEFAQLVGEIDVMQESLEMIQSETLKVLVDSSFEDLEPKTVLEIFSMEPLNITSELDLFNAAERYAKAQEKRTWDADADAGPSKRGLTILGFTQLKDFGLETKSVPEVKIEVGAEVPHQNEAGISRQNEPDADTEMSVLNEESGEENIANDNEPAQNTTDSNVNQNPAGDQDDNTMSDVSEINLKLDATIRKALQQIRFLTISSQQLAKCPTLKTLLTESEILALFVNIASTDACMPMPIGFSESRVNRRTS